MANITNKLTNVTTQIIEKQAMFNNWIAQKEVVKD